MFQCPRDGREGTIRAGFCHVDVTEETCRDSCMGRSQRQEGPVNGKKKRS